MRPRRYPTPWAPFVLPVLVCALAVLRRLR